MGRRRRSLLRDGVRLKSMAPRSNEVPLGCWSSHRRFPVLNASESNLASSLHVLSEVSMSKKATPQDARLILQLYRLRRETQMRKARNWWLTDFWPENAGDYLKVEMARKTPQSDWLRQVVSYWGMAASFVLHGTVSETVFLDASSSKEMFFIFAKLQPFLKELRRKTLNPDLMANIEKVTKESKTS